MYCYVDLLRMTNRQFSVVHIIISRLIFKCLLVLMQCYILVKLVSCDFWGTRSVPQSLTAVMDWGGV